MDKLEGQGALNFLSMDDMYVRDEGEIVDHNSVLSMDGEKISLTQKIETLPNEFIMRLERIEKKWAVLLDSSVRPILLINKRSIKDFVSDFTYLFEMALKL